MAQSITDIENVILTEKAAKTSLSVLTSPSATAIWREKVNVFARAHQAMQKQWDVFKAEILGVTSQQYIGTTPWYRGLALNYLNGTLITRASCRENGEDVILKVSKGSANLTLTELSDFRLYMNVKKVKGTRLSIVSQTADLLSLKVSLKYIGVSATVQAAAKAAALSYINAIDSEEFSKTLFEEMLLNVPGVEDCNVEELLIDIGFGYAPVAENTVHSDSGYFEVGKDLSANDLITFSMYQ